MGNRASAIELFDKLRKMLEPNLVSDLSGNRLACTNHNQMNQQVISAVTPSSAGI